jgi:hypothetical protein
LICGNEGALQYAAEYEAWKDAGNREGAVRDPLKLYEEDKYLIQVALLEGTSM